MTAATPVPALMRTAHDDHVFPALTDGQLARMAAHGAMRHVESGEVLVEAGSANVPLFVVHSFAFALAKPVK